MYESVIYGPDQMHDSCNCGLSHISAWDAVAGIVKAECHRMDLGKLRAV